MAYTDRTAFLNALTASANEDFNDLSPGYVKAARPVSEGSFDYTIRVFDEYWTERNDWAVEGDQGSLYARVLDDGFSLGTLSTYNIVEFTFESSNIKAFGGYFFGVDYMSEIDPTTDLTFTLNDSGGFATDFTYTLNNIATPTFIGFITDAPTFRWIDVDPSFSPYVAFDNLTVGTTVAVPEPSTYALLGLGFGLGLMVYRRRCC